MSPLATGMAACKAGLAVHLLPRLLIPQSAVFCKGHKHTERAPAAPSRDMVGLLGLENPPIRRLSRRIGTPDPPTLRTGQCPDG